MRNNSADDDASTAAGAGTRDCGMMEIVESNPSPAEQARQWVIKMDGGELSHKDRERLREWLRFSPENRAALREARRLWHTLDDWRAQLPQRAPSGRFMALVKAADPAAAPAFRWVHQARGCLRPGNALAASLTLGLLSLGLWQFAPPPEGRYETGRGDMLSHQLDDGSTITLNTQTSVDVVFSATERRVILRRGEGFFSVAKDPSRPFVVHAAGGTVEAIGTAFNVRRLDDTVAVTVTEGIVAVSPAEQNAAVAQRLTANQFLRYGDDLGVPAVRDAQAIAQSLAWRDGKLHFDDTTLEEFLAEVNRYSNNQLMVVDADLKQIRVGGVFTAGDADGIIKALEASFAMQAVGLTPGLTLLYKKNGD
ncbi:DUF4880 domain-containing protein [Exilibacterium tricleocarpae]|uniref:DUF4880 domain-containing protein n=1 Tax=Exilibacterium tricleocarpae TaxID=2591008 RepID=A0A545TFN1_9GAMM|nr:FecR domain-containing protein [Exilibacterium tricleocarpae]TQV76037.1 DUF4880 domain-containing protein [Exilibacterium tricleocarpae]